jgi:hypothetical protein
LRLIAHSFAYLTVATLIPGGLNSWNLWLVDIHCWHASTFKGNVGLRLIMHSFAYLTIANLLLNSLNFCPSPANGGIFN